ncbi:MAG: hypothetical protein AAB404_02680 [Patescibacteria group bacterium]
MKSIVSRTLSVHKEHEVLLKLEAAGLNDKLAQKIIDSKGNELATKVVRLIQNKDLEISIGQKRAREIMDKNFFGIEEAIKYFGVNTARQQLAALSEIPFSEAVLKELKDAHILVAVFPLSILDIRDKVECKLFCSHEDAWYDKQAFAEDKNEAFWQLVRKTSVPNSTSKTWDEQQTLLGKDDETPSARVMTYVIIGHYLATGERLFDNIYVRTSSFSSDGRHVDVSSFGRDGLGFNDFWDDSPRSDIGLASARKVQSH